ncbi:MAG TPA: hypothetical protein ENN60_03070 [archaeon]|nr:hypothetical protein [archaeon]
MHHLKRNVPPDVPTSDATVIRTHLDLRILFGHIRDAAQQANIYGLNDYMLDLEVYLKNLVSLSNSPVYSLCVNLIKSRWLEVFNEVYGTLEKINGDAQNLLKGYQNLDADIRKLPDSGIVKTY